MSDLSFWLVFLAAALALNLSPGPDLIYILSRTIAQGKKIGVASSLGVGAGALVHALAAALGLSALLAASALAFAVVKYAGAAYLIYLGVQALRSRRRVFDIDGIALEPVTPRQAFRQGALVDILNPKVALFFMAFLPQFVRPQLGSPTLQVFALGILVIAIGVAVELSFVYAAARATIFFRTRTHASVWLDRLLGSVFIALGLRLAAADREP